MSLKVWEKMKVKRDDNEKERPKLSPLKKVWQWLEKFRIRPPGRTGSKAKSLGTLAPLLSLLYFEAMAWLRETFTLQQGVQITCEWPIPFRIHSAWRQRVLIPERNLLEIRSQSAEVVYIQKVLRWIWIKYLYLACESTEDIQDLRFVTTGQTLTFQIF